jgi:hypothetical protein
MDPDEKSNEATVNGELEGEGNKTADKQYREAATSYARSGEAMKKALEAERDLEKSPEEYKRAEERGRAPAGGDEDLPDDISGKSFDKKI